MTVDPKFYRYLQATSIQFLDDVVSSCRKSDLVSLALESPVQAIETIVSKISDGYMPLKASVRTLELEKLDDARDKALRGIISYVEAYTLHYDDEMRLIAQKVLNQINSYGKAIARQKYQIETVVIRNLCVDLMEKPDMISAIATMNLTDWIAHLNTKNEAFNTLYLQRVDEEASKITVDKRQLISEGIEAYKSLVSLIDAHAILNPSEGLSELISRLEALATKYNESN